VANDDQPLLIPRERLQQALRRSMRNEATGEDLALIAAMDHGKIVERNRRETQKIEDLIEMHGRDPLDRERAWVGDALIFCPLPFKKPHDKQVVRRAKTGSGQELEVIYTATGKASLPFAEDAFLLDLLVSQARKSGSPEVTFDSLRALIDFMGVSDGGSDYKRLRQRIERIMGLHIRIERKDAVRVNVRVVDVENVEDIGTKKTQLLEGQHGQRRLLPYVFRFAPEFYDDLMRHYTVIPLDFLKAFSGSPIEYSIARWLYRRVIHAESFSVIPWKAIHDERCGDTEGKGNVRRTRAYTRNVIRRLKVVWPGLESVVDDSKAEGLVIRRSIPPLIPSRLAPGKPS
jgi:hypothetical protein